MMGKLIEKFEKIKASKDSDEINTFLIELGNNPKKEYLAIIDYFVENYNPEIFSQIKLNLIYTLGQIGMEQSLDDKYLNFLIEHYYSSDRWVRNEILSAINKIANHIQLSEEIFNMLEYALLDEYLPISINALKAMLLYETIPINTFKKFFKLLQNPDVALQDLISSVLKKFIRNEEHLYELLNAAEIYQMFTKKAFRFLLLTFFNSAMSVSKLESFRELFESSEWENEYKVMFLNEIDIYQKLLLKSL